jgi:hypothetical protein
MSGDYTRLSFDPRKLFSGVHQQQGRVSLDADFNEFEEMLDRRARSQMLDTVGPGVVPVTTKDGFKIDVENGNVTIGVGRAYVDGIQVECFGDKAPPSAQPFDDALGNLVGAAPLGFESQPFYYRKDPPYVLVDFPSVTHEGKNLVYLEAWQREVTSWEDEDLLDSALGGPDTATRVQTAWQVKAIPATPARCGYRPASWALSSARLNAKATPGPAASNPCQVPPTGGYVGPENRLYRVEVQKRGTLGKRDATVKWSRDNGSLVASVVGIKAVGSQSVVTVGSTGRDLWMRFEKDQTIELVDDHIEYSIRETGQGGPIARIVSVDHASGQVTIDKDLSGYASREGRHLRIRRWDGVVEGVAGASEVKLGDDGITISFAAGPGKEADQLLAGDYWVFAARLAEGPGSILIDAPARGILHHFMPLAIVPGLDNREVDDCRNIWPFECECGSNCDYCVTVDLHNSGKLTVQDAVQQATHHGGGTVCIGAGEFDLHDERIDMSAAIGVHVRGRGVRTVLGYGGTGPAIRISDAMDVRVEDLTLISDRTRSFVSARVGAAQVGAAVPAAARESAPSNAIEVSNSLLVALERLTVVEDPVALIGSLQRFGSASSPSAKRGAVEETPTRMAGGAIGLDGLVVAGTIRDCVLVGGFGVAASGVVSGVRGGAEKTPDLGKRMVGTTAPGAGTAELPGYLIAADLDIQHVFVFAAEMGIGLASMVPGTVLVADRALIEDCYVYGCEWAGIAVLAKNMGIVQVRNNTVHSFGSGILIGADSTSVAGNLIRPLGTAQACPGIRIVEGDDDCVSNVRVLTNDLGSFRGPGIAIQTQVADLIVQENAVRDCRQGIVMDPESSGDRVTIARNAILSIVPEDRDACVVGIGVTDTVGGQIIDNTISDVAKLDAAAAFGIRSEGPNSLRIAGNVISDVGGKAFAGLGAGIASSGDYERLDIHDNSVNPSPDLVKAIWHALAIGTPAEKESADQAQTLGGQTAPAGARTAEQLFEANAQLATVVKVAGRAFKVKQDGITRLALPELAGVANVCRNQFATVGKAPAVEIAAAGSCNFSENWCRHDPPETESPVIVLGHSATPLPALIVSTNQVRQTNPKRTAIQAWVVDHGSAEIPDMKFVAVGNITQGPIEVNASELTSLPWGPINLRLY